MLPFFSSHKECHARSFNLSKRGKTDVSVPNARGSSENENNSRLVPLQRFRSRPEIRISSDLPCSRQFFSNFSSPRNTRTIRKISRKFPRHGKYKLSPLVEHELACNRLGAAPEAERAGNANLFPLITVTIPPLIKCTCFQVIANGLKSETDSCDGLTNGESRRH